MKVVRKLVLLANIPLITSWAAVPQFNGVHRDLPLPASQRPVAVGDFNGDGKLDFAEASTNTNAIIVALAAAHSGFTYAKLPLITDAGGVSAVDINGDGKLDLVAAGRDIQVFLGNGDGTFAAPINRSIGGYAISQTIADFNGDGKLDLAVGLSAGVQLFWGNGDGTFTTGTFLPGDTYVIVAATDFNGDAIPDLVAVGTSLSVYLGVGNGTFQKRTSPAPAGQVTELAVADFNRDQVPDVALNFASNDTQSSGTQVYLGNHDGTLRLTTTKTTANLSTATGVAAGDFDGDGKPDLVVLSWIGPKPNANSLNAVSVFAGNGDGTVSATSCSTPVGNRPEAATAVDWNGDGKLDLIVSDYTDDSGFVYGISLLEGLGNCLFSEAPSILTEPNGGISAVATGDFNGDGLPDVVTADAKTSDVSVLLNGGSGLKFPVSSPAGLPAQLIAVGDVNNDGKLDVVVMGGRSLNASVLLGEGNGTFQSPLTVPMGLTRGPIQIAVADFNADGNLDIVALDGTEHVYVSFGLGGGAFAPPLTLTEKYPAQYLAVGDVNGDGIPDIITFQGGGYIDEFLSGGDGTFSPYIQLQGYQGLNQIYLVDVNGDGKLDIVFVSDPVTVVLGNGDGTFGSLVLTNAGSFGGGPLAFADFNGDGKLDIAVAASFYNSTVILEGNGDGTFTNAGSYAARYYPTSIATIDVNHDGKPDVISANSFGISVLGNAAP